MAQNIIYYPPTDQGWGLVVRLQQQIKVFPINGDMRDAPELVLETGEEYVGFDQIERYLQLPRPVVHHIPPAHRASL